MDSTLLLLDSKPEIDPAKLKTWSRLGLSISGLVLNPRHNLDEVVRIYQDIGVQLTRINLLATSWVNPTNYMPFTRLADGKWDLYQWDSRYFDRLSEVKERMNAAGITIIWTNYELYSWSHRKLSAAEQEGTPWRTNINGVNWEREDTTLYRLPDAWSKAWFEKVVPYLDLNPNVFEIGNEFPEKGVHQRVRDVVRAIQPDALISVNRNEDTPGQYTNMKIGKDYDMISFHGRRLKTLGDLKQAYPESRSQMLPTATFQELLDAAKVENKRIIFSSDGARTSDDPVETYDWGKLKEFIQEVRGKGCSFEHQSRAKMTSAPNHTMIEADWFKSLHV